MHLAFTGFVLWRIALYSVLFWLRASSISLWLRVQVIALARLSLRRHMRSLRCGGQVGFIKWLYIWVKGGQDSYGRVRFDRCSMCSIFDVRSSVRLVNEGNHEYKSGTRK